MNPDTSNGSISGIADGLKSSTTAGISSGFTFSGIKAVLC